MTARAKRRHHSERRQRTEMVMVRFTPEEREKLAAAAVRCQVSIPALLRGPLADLIEFGGYK